MAVSAQGDSAPWSYEEAVKSFFDRRRFLKVLHDYIIFLTKDDELTKVILRQHQTRAVEKVIERVAHPTKRRGLIWHTQGSGKTLTMITIAARLLRDVQGEEKPTVVMLVDRNELEAQLFRNITAYGIGTVQVAQSKEDLRRILRSDYRGLVVSMIHKFDRIDADMCPRANVVVLVDEAHRTTGGDLGNYLVAALPNATYIGFTGTPIDRLASGKGTFKVFGADDPQGYLDKYSIAESIADGTTVPLNYALAPSDLRVDRETLDREFLDLREAEGVSDQAELDAVLTRAVQLKEMMKAPDRVDKIARFVADHYRDNVEPMGFKAFLVGVDREACALYKDALDRYLPKAYSTVVYSPGPNDTEKLKAYYLTEDAGEDGSQGVRPGGRPAEDSHRHREAAHRLRRAGALLHVPGQADARPRAAPGHRARQPALRGRGWASQALRVRARFRGHLREAGEALAFDSDMVASVIRNIDVLRDLFGSMMREQAPAYLPLTRGMDDKAKERAVVAMQDKEKREAFFKFFRQLQSLYDILSPDVTLRPFIDDYNALAVLFAWIRQAYSDRVYVDQEFTAKTKALLQRHTQSGVLAPPTVVYEIGQSQLLALRESSADDTVKVLNLRKLLAGLVEEEGAAKPYLLSIGERAQALAQAFDDRQIDTREALKRFEALVQETIDAETRRQDLKLDANGFAIYTALEATTSAVTPAQAQAINGLFRQHPDYRWDGQQESALRAELYKVLRPIVGAGLMVAAANALLRLERV